MRHHALPPPPEPEIYLGYESYPMTWGYLAARAEGDPSGLVSAIRRVAAEVDPEQPAYDIATLDDLVAGSTGPRKLVALLALVFAMSALVIMAAGVYGIVATHVTGLTRELGLRSALGARASSLIARATHTVAVVLAAGVGLGCVASVGGRRVAATWLYDTPLPGAGSLLVAGVAIVVTASAAAYLPARKATRIHPVRALAVD